jgi:class 3 adenylate cyclase
MREWLEQIGLGRYAPVFDEHEITLDLLPDLTETDIDKLALPIGPRRRLILAIHSLDGASDSHAAAAPVAAAPGTIEAERRQLTVMFCDLVGSTALAESLDPEELRDLMRAYRTAATRVVERYEGHVAQYLGDGLMVYFGWPVAHEDDAERGVRAALEIVDGVAALETPTPLAVRISVATGTVVVGEDAASGAAEARLAVGETPNLAARLQGLADANAVVIAPATRRLVGDAFDLSDLGTHAVKGISEPVRIWRVESVRRSGGRFGAARGASRLTPLVGRAGEAGQLLRAWDLARFGNGQVVLVGGEPGIGKSRLAHVLAERLAGDDRQTLQYQCSPYHVHSALHPFIDELESAAGFSASDGPDRKLDRLEALLTVRGLAVPDAAPLIASLLSLPADRYPQPPLSAQARKEKTLGVLAGQVEALARRQPVLLIFEDAHWIDPTS